MTTTGWTGVVLTGGKSSRMGRDKALIEVDGRTMLRRAVDLLAPVTSEVLVIGDPMKHGTAQAVVIADDVPGQGPLGGLVTALRHARHDRLIVLGCDLPGLTDRFIRHIQLALTAGADAVVPEHDGAIEPLAACYHGRCLAVFEERMARGLLSMHGALDRVRAVHAPVTPGADGWPADLFRNVNAPGDL